MSPPRPPPNIKVQIPLIFFKKKNPKFFYKKNSLKMVFSAASSASIRLSNPHSYSSSSSISPFNFNKKFTSLPAPVKFFSINCTLTREPVPAAPVYMDSDPTGWIRPDSFGRFGKFGGKYVPETLMSALSELETAFHSLSKDEKFQVSFRM